MIKFEICNTCMLPRRAAVYIAWPWAAEDTHRFLRWRHTAPSSGFFPEVNFLRTGTNCRETTHAVDLPGPSTGYFFHAFGILGMSLPPSSEMGGKYASFICRDLLFKLQLLDHWQWAAHKPTTACKITMVDNHALTLACLTSMYVHNFTT